MTTRQFDPVFSAALRAELESVAERSAAPARRPVLLRPQVWISVVTALVLAAATLGILRITAPPAPPAASAPAVVDPLSRITDPSSPYYVARSVTTLIDARGSGTGTRSFDVPGDVRGLQVYLNCTGRGKYAVEVDRGGAMTGSSCDHDSGTNFSTAVTPGRHRVTVTVGAAVRFALTIIEKPAPTVAAGALVDPLTQVRDPRDPDALTGDTRPLLRVSGQGDGRVQRFTVPPGVRRVRVLLTCAPGSLSTRVEVDGREAAGCMNAIAHWLDLTPSARSVSAQVLAGPGNGPWSLLVVPAPKGAKDSPAATALPYPATEGTLLARARGTGATASGTFVEPGTAVQLTTSCRGTGWLEITVGASGTNTRGQACAASMAAAGFGGDHRSSKPQRWSVIPHGDISWTVQVTADE